MRGALIIALGLMKDPEAFGHVARIATSKVNDDILTNCGWFFALMRDRRAVPILESILREAGSAETQETAATALGILGAVESHPLLVRLLTSPSSTASLRLAAATGLGRMRDRRGIDPLIAATKSEALSASAAAAVTALGAVGRRTERPPFARVAIDAYYGICNEAIDEVARRAGSIMKQTEEGGSQSRR